MTPEELFFDRIAPTSVTRCPRRVLSIVCELKAAKRRPRGATVEIGTALDCWALSEYRYDEYGRWSVNDYCGESAEDHWKLLYHLLHGRATTWIVCPSVSEWLASTGGYEELTAGRLWIPGKTDPDSAERYTKGCSRKQRDGWLTLNGPTEIICGRYLSTDVRCVALSNYGISDYSQFAADNLCPAALSGFVANGPERFAGRSVPLARAIGKWFTRTVDAWRNGDCGMFAETASKLSFNFYRRQYATKAVVKHKHLDSHRLERAGLFGGRADVFRYGKLKGQYHYVDCRSMYPSILASERCPVAWETYREGGTVAQLADACQCFGVMATVTIFTKHDRYPFRLRLNETHRTEFTGKTFKADTSPVTTRTIFPVGWITTVLTGDELKAALESDEIKTVHNYAVYRLSSEFQPMLKHCLDERKLAAESGDRGGSDFWKLIANSFGGRWAQRNGGWVSREDLHPHDAWAEWVQDHPELKIPCRCRTIGFVHQIYEPMSDIPKGCPIIFAWLTAQGRYRLWQWIQAADPSEVIQCDTDGLWVTNRGLGNLEAAPGLLGGEPGELRVERTASTMEFFTPRHNRIDGQLVMSGFSDGFQVTNDGKIVDFQRQSYYPADTANGPSQTILHERTIDIESIADYHRRRLKGGKTAPWVLEKGSSKLHGASTPASEAAGINWGG
jgi:DNA polymerase type B, organellar and viral